MSSDSNIPSFQGGQDADYPESSHTIKVPHEKRVTPRMLEMHREEGIDIRRILFLLLKRLWIIGIVLVIGMVVLFKLFTGKNPVFESQAILQVAQQEEHVLKAESVTQESPGSADFLNTVAQSLTNRNILKRVIKANKLATDPRFVPQRNDGTKYSEDQLCDILVDKYRIFPQKGTRLITVVARDGNPQLACALAGSLVREFIRDTYQQKSSASKLANEFLSEEAAKLKDKLQQSEQALQSYKEAHQAVSLEQNQNIIVEKLRQLSGMVTQAQDARLKIEADLEQYRRTDPSNTNALLNISSVASLPRVSDARARLQAAQLQLNTLKERYLPLHPHYIEAASRIKECEVALGAALANAGQELNNEYERAKETEGKMQQSLKEQEDKALDLNKLAIPYNVLTREVETDTALYQSVVSRMKETGVKASEESSPFTIAEEPLVSSSPLPSSAPRYLLIGFILLLAGSIAGVLVQDRLSATVRSVDEAESRFHHPVLGSIPEESKAVDPKKDLDPENQTSSRSKRVRNKNYSVAIQDQPNSSIAESYRTLRTSLMLMDAKLDTSTLLITSAIPSEGKTYCTVNTAASFATLGKKTLLIDADLRRPMLHHALLDSQVIPGLADYLGEQAEFDQVIQPTNIPNLFVITAGNRSPIPSELLAGPRMDHLLKEMASRFDRVLIDSAPIHAVSDTLILASKIKTVALVIRSEVTIQHAISRALLLLHDTGVSVAGLILNRMKKSGAGYYYYYYYGGRYSNYGNEKPRRGKSRY